MQDGQNSLTGRVEICMDKVWGSICDTLWDAFDAAVVCRQLGFSDQGMYVHSRYVVTSSCDDLYPLVGKTSIGIHYVTII